MSVPALQPERRRGRGSLRAAGGWGCLGSDGGRSADPDQDSAETQVVSEPGPVVLPSVWPHAVRSLTRLSLLLGGHPSARGRGAGCRVSSTCCLQTAMAEGKLAPGAVAAASSAPPPAGTGRRSGLWASQDRRTRRRSRPRVAATSAVHTSGTCIQEGGAGAGPRLWPQLLLVGQPGWVGPPRASLMLPRALRVLNAAPQLQEVETETEDR